MDYSAAWTKTTETTKSAYAASAKGVTNTLDALTPACVPFAVWWDTKAERRSELRTDANRKALHKAIQAHSAASSEAASAAARRRKERDKSKNPFAEARRAAAQADRAAARNKRETKDTLREARRNYPQTMNRLAAKVHAAHLLPSVALSYVTSTDAHWTLWPAGTSLAVIAVNVGALWLGHREVSLQLDEDLSAEERRLCERLAPSHWAQHAEERGLFGTITTPAEITPAGIVCGVRLDGKWTVKELAAKSESIRALLGMATERRMEIGRGSQGDWARIIIRTRSASDGMSMIWTPDHEGIGVDEVDGSFVSLPLKAGLHILIAGITGMGKSVSWRALLLEAIRREDWTAVVIDPKRQEAIGVQHVVRAVGQEPNREKRMADIYAMVKELTREMHRRQGIATGADWVPDGRPENRNLLVIIDEGAAIVRMAKQRQYADVLDMLEELWSEARAVGFQFVWATQNPTKTAGVPPLVKDNMSARLALTTGAGEHERSIFGESAQQTGWTPSELDGMPGRAMLQYQKRRPNPLRLWFVPADEIAALPAEEPWHSPAPEDSPEGPQEPAPAPVDPDTLTDNQRAVLEAVRGGATTNVAIANALDINPGSVKRAVDALVKLDALTKSGTTISLGGAA
ncbi:FtsK/SpoIIIE domain-containing protein [Streptomyces sp. SP17BM10]|uniref:FtsK/SpoIIIE domain-containing protein n=1 Tax=Streptomyces sp. SP17BM10 TaxID=3002530 RepID=UPI002E7687C2|nr:FtsK/SpoIIIE domain-containing protein [Streptomyces sp. SP17BM10]MEE1783895.1 FtsK/SpoIIIE domain-containing protein [Streptomyces sp. SP17BM10]